MQEEFKVALVQTNLVWENPKQNRNNLTHKINAITEKVDLVILPEMFTSGFTMQPENVAETMQGKTVLWMKELASKMQAAVTGSIVISENGNYYNRLIFADPNGEIFKYDKRHTFTLAGEDKVYNPGKHKEIIEYKGWKICPMICYDLRFPVWARNSELYDVLLYVANWPIPRIDAWNTLLKARAIENMSYCIGVNRVGTDGVNIQYNGSSAVYDVLGKKLSDIELHKEDIAILTLSKSHIKNYRRKLKFLMDKDNFKILE
ncbi:MAG: amidohydrolase [Jejuia sp.]